MENIFEQQIDTWKNERCSLKLKEEQIETDLVAARNARFYKSNEIFDIINKNCEYLLQDSTWEFWKITSIDHFGTPLYIFKPVNFHKMDILPEYKDIEFHFKNNKFECYGSRDPGPMLIFRYQQYVDDHPGKSVIRDIPIEEVVDIAAKHKINLTNLDKVENAVKKYFYNGDW